MPKLSPTTVPSYRLHKQSGQAIVTLNSRDFLLGKFGSTSSHAEYNRLAAEWLAHGRKTPSSIVEITISDLLLKYHSHCTSYYRRPNGTPSPTLNGIARAMRVLRETYGSLSALKFGPLALETVRDQMIRKGWCRTSVNKNVGIIVRMFKWCASRELIPPSIYQALATVEGLKRGRSDAHDPDPVKPVADEVEATLPFLTPTVRAMVEVQRLTGARPGEICNMRIGELNRDGDAWSYRPSAHKTLHHGKDRIIFLGGRAREVIRPFVFNDDPAAFVFSPARSVYEMRQRRTAARKTPRSCGNRPGTSRVESPKRQAALSFDVASYRRSIARAADRADQYRQPTHCGSATGCQSHRSSSKCRSVVSPLGEKTFREHGIGTARNTPLRRPTRTLYASR